MICHMGTSHIPGETKCTQNVKVYQRGFRRKKGEGEKSRRRSEFFTDP